MTARSSGDRSGHKRRRQFVVDPAMRFAGAAIDTSVELRGAGRSWPRTDAEAPDVAGWVAPFLKLSPFQLPVLAAVQQGAHLLGIEQPGCLGRPRRSRLVAVPNEENRSKMTDRVCIGLNVRKASPLPPHWFAALVAGSLSRDVG